MYLANNSSVYLAAFSGAMTGMGVAQRQLTVAVPTSTTYLSLFQSADAFAQALDALIPAGSANPTLVALLGPACFAAFADRSASLDVNAGDYTAFATALLAFVAESGAYLTANTTNPAPVSSVIVTGLVIPPIADGAIQLIPVALPAPYTTLQTLGVPVKINVDPATPLSDGIAFVSSGGAGPGVVNTTWTAVGAYPGDTVNLLISF